MSDENTVIPIESLPPLSHSSLKVFQQCPYQYLRVYLLKNVVKEGVSHPAAIWGNEAHKALELYFKDGTPLPEQFANLKSYAEKLDSIKGERHIELKLAVDDKLEPIDFFDKAGRYRGVLDFLVLRDTTAFLIDHKSGKVRPTEQMALGAILVFAHWPQIETVKAAFYWLKYDTFTKYTFTRDELERIDQLSFRPFVMAIQATAKAGNWIRKPSGLCPWCPVVDCEYQEGTRWKR